MSAENVTRKELAGGVVVMSWKDGDTFLAYASGPAGTTAIAKSPVRPSGAVKLAVGRYVALQKEQTV